MNEILKKLDLGNDLYSKAQRDFIEVIKESIVDICEKYGLKSICFEDCCNDLPYLYDEENQEIDGIASVRIKDNMLEVTTTFVEDMKNESEDLYWFDPFECGVVNWRDMKCALDNFIYTKMEEEEFSSNK